MKYTCLIITLLALLSVGLQAQQQSGTAASGVSESAGNKLQSIAGGPAPALNGGMLGRQLLDNYVAGDADGNRILNITDAVYLIVFIFNGGYSPSPYVAGDANCDGLVNIADATFLVTFIFGGGPAPEYCY